MNKDSGHQRRLYPVVMGSTALAFGCMIASLEALRPSGTGFTFEVTFRTLIAFLLGGAIAFPFWRMILNGTDWSQRKLTVVGTGLVVVLLLLGVGAFLYPLRFVPKDKLPEIRTGLVTAVFALSGVGCLLWGVKRFVDSDEKQEKLEHPVV